MTKDEYKRNMLRGMKMFLKTVKPWKENGRGDDYQQGWNACIKEIQKRADEYFKEFEKL